MATFIKFLLSLISLVFLVARPFRALIFTSNNFSKYGKFDYRFYSLFKVVHDNNLKYTIGIRTRHYPSKIIVRYFLRFKPVIYFDSFNELMGLLFPLKSSRHVKGRGFSEYISDAKNIIDPRSVKYSIFLHKVVLKVMRPSSAFIADNCERSNIILVACNLLDIPTIGIQNGVETIYYNVQKFHQYSSESNSLMAQRHYGVWSEGVLNYYLGKSKLYDITRLEVSGKLRVINSSLEDFKVKRIRNICWLVEIHVDRAEIIPFIRALLESRLFNVVFKIDPTKYNNSIHYFKQLKEDLSEFELISTDLTIEEASVEYDLFIGAFSTALIDASSNFKPVLLIETNQWGNYYDLDADYPLLIKRPEELINGLLDLDFKSQREFKNMYAPVIVENGPEWIVTKLKRYGKNY